MVLLVPADEREVVLDLDASRDRLLEPARAHPVVLFLLRNGDGRPGGDRQGSGACGHAAFHCHVGPTLDAEPKVRVPLPPLHPADALDWVLSQVVPGYEPAPWSDVEAAASGS